MALQVRLYGERAGILSEEKGWLEFTYAPEYLQSGKAVPLSRMMPLKEGPTERGIAMRWFDGLLPEEDRREVIAEEYGIASMSTYSMLRAIGRECAGAVEVYEGDREQVPGLGRVTEENIEKSLRRMMRRQTDELSRNATLSLAGAQPKLALVRETDGGWSYPMGGYPSTHIIKPEQEQYPGLVRNEHLCMTLARRSGIAAAETQIEKIGDLECLVVKRFDRTASGERIHQEDFAQALGADEKYERLGGPSLESFFRGIRVAPERIWEQVVYAVLIGDEDKHAKNFSIQYPREGEPGLAPIYDAVCTKAFPKLGRQMAWRFGTAYEIDRVSRNGVRREAIRCGLDPEEALQAMHEVAQKVRDGWSKMEEEGWNLKVLEATGIDERLSNACKWAR